MTAPTAVAATTLSWRHVRRRRSRRRRRVGGTPLAAPLPDAGCMWCSSSHHFPSLWPFWLLYC